MKRILLLTALLISLRAFAPCNEATWIGLPEPVKPYEAIFKAICFIESSGNPLAIGDKHLNEFSYGIAQIRMVRLNDYFKRTGTRYYEHDMFDPAKSKIVFLHYASQYKPHDFEAISRAWNAGPRWEKVKASKKYWKNVQKHL